MKFLELAVGSCPKCGFDLDAYDDNGVTVLMCCNCDYKIRHEYYCVVCGKWFEFDPYNEPHTTEDGEDCHAECCPKCHPEKERKSW